MSTIIPLSTAIFASRLAVPLPRYAQIIEYSEPAFFGVNHSSNSAYQCREIWTHEQRLAVYRALQNAQSKMEQVTEYPLYPTWIGPERHSVAGIQVLKNSYLIQMGQKEVANVQLGVACNHANDPVQITIAVAFTDVNEVHIYHPGTDVEIYPSSMEITGGNLIIEIPRVRMVALAYEDNPESGLDYTDTSLFEATVDVKREFLSSTLPSVQFISRDCSTNCSCPTETLTSGCANIDNLKLGIIQIGTIGCACLPAYTSMVDLYYQAGLQSLTAEAEDIMVRLAHSLLPNEPCGCDFLKGRWKMDQNVPEVLTAERENCPWGMSDGAWQAYEFAMNLRILRTSIL